VVVEVPDAVSKWSGERVTRPCTWVLTGIGIAAALVPGAAGRHKLYLSQEMRQAAGLAIGDKADIRLCVPSPRISVIPDDLASAVQDTGLLEAFTGWLSSHQRENILAIEDAIRPETRQRRIQRTVDDVRARSSSSSSGR